MIALRRTKVLSKDSPRISYLVNIIFTNLFYYLTYFWYYSWLSLHFLVLFMSLIVLFFLTFTFIYGIFSKKFSVSAK